MGSELPKETLSFQVKTQTTSIKPKKVYNNLSDSVDDTVWSIHYTIPS